MQLVRVLRGVLGFAIAVAILIVTALEVSQTTPSASPLVAKPSGTWTARAAFLLGDGITCSGTLVGPDVILTAAHCVFSSDGTVRAPMTAHFAVDDFDVETLQVDAAVSCNATRVWSATTTPGGVSVDDWALLRVGACTDATGRRTHAPGDVLGYQRVAPYGSGERAATYVGYPGREDGPGQVQKLKTVAGYTPPALRLFHPVVSGSLVCLEGAEVPPGGSGGGLVVDSPTFRSDDHSSPTASPHRVPGSAPETSTSGSQSSGSGTVVAVNNFMAVSSSACFRKVDTEIALAAAAAAAGHWPADAYDYDSTD